MSGEFDRIRQYFLPLSKPAADPAAVIGNGDDALAVRTSETLVMSIDTAVAGTHFPASANPEDIACKALRSALSDLAAMGARPWFYTLSLVVPKALPESWWQRFGETLQAENEHWQCPCLGGDTTSGDTLVVTVQVQGLCERPLTRSSAQPGQDIWITGYPGEAAAGLAELLKGEAPDDRLRRALYQPEPPVRLMATMQPWAEAAIDVSDGLVADLGHIARASKCSMQVSVEKIPISDALSRTVGQDQARQLALCGGEDYCTAFTAWPEHAERIQALAESAGVRLTCIGRVGHLQPGASDLTLSLDGEPYSISRQGYDHFV